MWVVYSRKVLLFRLDSLFFSVLSMILSYIENLQFLTSIFSYVTMSRTYFFIGFGLRISTDHSLLDAIIKSIWLIALWFVDSLTNCNKKKIRRKRRVVKNLSNQGFYNPFFEDSFHCCVCRSSFLLCRAFKCDLVVLDFYLQQLVVAALIKPFFTSRNKIEWFIVR